MLAVKNSVNTFFTTYPLITGPGVNIVWCNDKGTANRLRYGTVDVQV